MSQLEKLNFNGQIIYPFNTYGSIDLGESINDIQKLCPEAIVKNGFGIKDNAIKIKEHSKKQINEWLNENFEEYEEINDNERSDRILFDQSKILKINFFMFICLYILFYV